MRARWLRAASIMLAGSPKRGNRSIAVVRPRHPSDAPHGPAARAGRNEPSRIVPGSRWAKTWWPDCVHGCVAGSRLPDHIRSDRTARHFSQGERNRRSPSNHGSFDASLRSVALRHRPVRRQSSPTTWPRCPQRIRPAARSGRTVRGQAADSHACS
jgi:hypothetical protein